VKREGESEPPEEKAILDGQFIVPCIGSRRGFREKSVARLLQNVTVF
jgi:hypothetical protein